MKLNSLKRYSIIAATLLVLSFLTASTAQAAACGIKIKLTNKSSKIIRFSTFTTGSARKWSPYLKPGESHELIDAKMTAYFLGADRYHPDVEVWYKEEDGTEVFACSAQYSVTTTFWGWAIIAKHSVDWNTCSSTRYSIIDLGGTLYYKGDIN